jgi:hypothetical protein
MHLAGAILTVPLGLDGESAGGGNSTAIAVISLISIVGGYVLLAGLWYFVFREKTRARRKKRSSE